MYNAFRNYLSGKTNLKEDEIQIIESLATLKKIRKKQFLLKEGDVNRFHTFILNGCMRIYTLNNHGAEHIIKFAVEDWWVSDRESLLHGTPATMNIDAIEDTDVLQWSNDNMELLFSQIPEFDRLFKKLLSKALNASTERINILISCSAEERLEAFIKKYPDVLNRVPQHMIASFLGITRETLSRVRNHTHIV